MPTSYPSSSSGLSRFFFPTKFFGLLLNCFTSVFRKYRPVSKISLWRRSAQAFSCLDQSNLEPWAPREERPILSWQSLFQSRWRSSHVFSSTKESKLALHTTRSFSDPTASAIFGTQFQKPNSQNWQTNIWNQLTSSLLATRNILARIPEKLFASKSFEEDWQGRERQDLLSLSLQGGDYTPWPAFAYSQQLLLASIMHVKPKDHHDPDVSGYR